MARGRLTRDWSVTSRRTQNDAFALKCMRTQPFWISPLLMLLPALLKSTMCQEPMLQLRLLSKRSSQHRSSARQNQNIFPRLSARWTFHSDAEIMELEARYLPHPVDGSFPASGYATFTHASFSNTGLLMPYLARRWFGPAVGDNEQLEMSGSDRQTGRLYLQSPCDGKYKGGHHRLTLSN